MIAQTQKPEEADLFLCFFSHTFIDQLTPNSSYISSLRVALYSISKEPGTTPKLASRLQATSTPVGIKHYILIVFSKLFYLKIKK